MQRDLNERASGREGSERCEGLCYRRSLVGRSHRRFYDKRIPCLSSPSYRPQRTTHLALGVELVLKEWHNADSHEHGE